MIYVSHVDYYAGNMAVAVGADTNLTQTADFC